MSIDPTLQVKKYTSIDGTVRYMKDGKLHNWEGPAIVHPNGKMVKKNILLMVFNTLKIVGKKLEKMVLVYLGLRVV